MLSFDDRSRNMFNPVPSQESGQAAPFTDQLSPMDDSPTQPQPAFGQTDISAIQSPLFSPVATRELTPLPESNVTRVLTGTLDASGQRAPVIIRGNMKKPVPASQMPPHPKRRKFASLIGIVVLFLIVSISLLTATPLGHSIGLNVNPRPSNGNMDISSGQSNASNSVGVIAQATATAVYTNQQSDGYDPSSNGNVVIGSGNSPRPWPYGQCTYWANLYYHQLTGIWVAWSGNADQWVAGASGAGWHVSTVPHVPSIMVLMPGVQGASYAYGHVAVVTAVIDSTTVLTSGMNWYANGGGLGIVSMVDFNYGPAYPGTYFVWRD